MFWSGDKLEAHKNDLIISPDGDSGADPKVDCASLVLTVGTEVFVTPKSDEDSTYGHQKKFLPKGGMFDIPKGQFGFILTEEYVSVPEHVVAFISFKAKYKFKGLINVSGFHVDPGYKGRLVFSVYNAGPSDVTLARGDEFALIWFADLDSSSSGKHAKKSDGFKLEKIDSSIISGIKGDVFSPFKLKDDINEIKAKNETHSKELDHELSLHKRDVKNNLEGIEERLANKFNSFRLAAILALIFSLGTIFSVIKFFPNILGIPVSEKAQSSNQKSGNISDLNIINPHVFCLNSNPPGHNSECLIKIKNE